MKVLEKRVEQLEIRKKSISVEMVNLRSKIAEKESEKYVPIKWNN